MASHKETNRKENKTLIPNQVFQPLGSCPCDLTSGACDVRCCCDQDCSEEGLKLFDGHCLQGPLGGQRAPTPDYQCSEQSAASAPDWFPFLCVTSPPENNPYLGLFYQGKTGSPQPGPSYQKPVLSAPRPAAEYRQGSPIFSLSDQYFTIPQGDGCLSPSFPCDGNTCGEKWRPQFPFDGRMAEDKLYKMSSWKLACGGGDPSSCLDPTETQLFPVSSSVTFTDIPVSTGPPKTRFQINFTEYDCDRNDVCWPELAFPLTRYYTGEPYSQSLAKGLILVFFFMVASVLGTPWRQIRQAWSTSSL
ncbi:hypothetical protein NHX12_029453 [Muraenolepis orangiensis]|uniref:Tectonic-1-3 N-terminal domain-containing protein n=1 Tax=Muraenolepis orangiensis TaxID=630683 RepID=A0A9Q0EC99_9TELE|nr:hypothetical protein NHX12_029453 [Muraenolepis orangiensis]